MFLRYLIVFFFSFSCSSWIQNSRIYSPEQQSDQKARTPSRKKVKDPKKRITAGQYNKMMKKYDKLYNSYHQKSEKKMHSMKDTSSMDASVPMKEKKEMPKAMVETSSMGMEKDKAKDISSAITNQLDPHAVLKSVDISPSIESPREKAQIHKLNVGTQGFMETSMGGSWIENPKIEDHLEKLKMARSHLHNRMYDKAMDIIKELENSPSIIVVAHTRFLLGELLFHQQEYDLAYQVFEEIIEKYAFSGIILKTLEMLVKCCDKLNLLDKKEKYDSMLNDIFV